MRIPAIESNHNDMLLQVISVRAQGTESTETPVTCQMSTGATLSQLVSGPNTHVAWLASPTENNRQASP